MTEQRLENIETKIAYQDDTIMQLNDVICKQQDQIDRLEKLTRQLVRRVKDLSDLSTGAPADFSAENERPPHY